MKHFSYFASAVVLVLVSSQSAWAEPVKVCVSSTDVKTIVEAVGGDAVEVTGFVKGSDDPHVVEPTRRMIQALAGTDLLVIVGNGLEEAWLPAMVAQAGREDIKININIWLTQMCFERVRNRRQALANRFWYVGVDAIHSNII